MRILRGELKQQRADFFVRTGYMLSCYFRPDFDLNQDPVDMAVILYFYVRRPQSVDGGRDAFRNDLLQWHSRIVALVPSVHLRGLTFELRG